MFMIGIFILIQECFTYLVGAYIKGCHTSWKPRMSILGESIDIGGEGWHGAYILWSGRMVTFSNSCIDEVNNFNRWHSLKIDIHDTSYFNTKLFLHFILTCILKLWTFFIFKFLTYVKILLDFTLLMV